MGGVYVWGAGILQDQSVLEMLESSSSKVASSGAIAGGLGARLGVGGVPISLFLNIPAIAV